MREEISDPHKLAVEADEIWQSSSAQSVKDLSPASQPLPDQDDYINALRQRPQQAWSFCLR